MNLKYLYLAFGLHFGGSDLLMGLIQYAAQSFMNLTQPSMAVTYSFMGLMLLLSLLAVIFAILSRDNQEARALSTVAVVVTSIALISDLLQIGLSALNGALV